MRVGPHSARPADRRLGFIHESEDAALAESLAGIAERYPEVKVRRVTRPRPAGPVAARPVGERSTDRRRQPWRGGFTGMLLGSTSAALTHSVECPITDRSAAIPYRRAPDPISSGRGPVSRVPGRSEYRRRAFADREPAAQDFARWARLVNPLG